MKYNQIIDISLPLNENTIVYPGNEPLSIESLKSENGQTFLSRIRLGSHAGTHVDAPRHVKEDLTGVGELPLRTMIGECRVFDFTHVDEKIRTEDLDVKIIRKGERILCKTNNSVRGFRKYYDDYIYLDGDAADYLAERDIALFGIDYLSVKKAGSEDTRAHNSLLEKNIPIIEGLDLKDVSEGSYFLVCLPLKFTELDGAPARTILLKF